MKYRVSKNDSFSSVLLIVLTQKTSVGERKTMSANGNAAFSFEDDDAADS
jgi:hypothetical protein